MQQWHSIDEVSGFCHRRGKSRAEFYTRLADTGRRRRGCARSLEG